MVLESVNFHFWSYCNFRCKYCFAQFENFIPNLSKEECLEIIKLLTESGTKKINFAGGEPTISPFLGSLLIFSKDLGLVTSIVSNGTGINEDFINDYKKEIDWIGLSIDSANKSTNKELGRGTGDLIREIIKKSKIIKKARIKSKINTVVSKLNYKEDLSWLIKKLKPERWKVFQVLEIKNQNHINLRDLLISDTEFTIFVENHKNYHPIIENNDLMMESYLMIDPLGRFYQNTENHYNFSRPILKVGLKNALSEIYYNPIKFIERGGIYAW